MASRRQEVREPPQGVEMNEVIVQRVEVVGRLRRMELERIPRERIRIVPRVLVAGLGREGLITRVIASVIIVIASAIIPIATVIIVIASAITLRRGIPCGLYGARPESE
jgi:predicted phage tail protein